MKGSLLKRCRRTYREIGMNFSYGNAEGRRRHTVSYAPSCAIEGLGQSSCGDGPALHSRQGGHTHVRMSIIGDRLIDLVSYCNEVSLYAETGNGFKLASGKNFSRGIVRSIDDNSPCLLAAEALKTLEVHFPAGGLKTDYPWNGRCHQYVGDIALKGRLKNDDLVTGIDY